MRRITPGFAKSKNKTKTKKKSSGTALIDIVVGLSSMKCKFTPFRGRGASFCPRLQPYSLPRHVPGDDPNFYLQKTWFWQTFTFVVRCGGIHYNTIMMSIEMNHIPTDNVCSQLDCHLLKEVSHCTTENLCLACQKTKGYPARGSCLPELSIL